MAAVIALILFLTAYMAGRTAFRAARLRPFDGPLAAAILETALGLWILSLLIFILGAAQRFSTATIWTGIFTLLIICLVIDRILKSRGMDNPDSADVNPAPRWKDAGRLLPIFWIAFCAAAAVNILRCFTPPMDMDPLVYHLTIPKQYLLHGGISYLPSILYANFPQTMEMLYAPGVSLNAPNAAHFLHTGIGLLAMALLCIWTGRTFGSVAALTAGLAFYLTPLMALEAPTAMIDLAPAFFILCATVLAANARQGDVKTAAAGMFFAGIAVSCKWTAAPIAAMLFVWTIVRVRAARPTAIAALAAAALFPAAPYLIKNILLVGNPLWPMFQGIFDSRDLPPEIARRIVNQIHGTEAMPRNFIQFLRLPWDVTMNTSFYEGEISFLFLCLTPMYVFVRKNSVINILLLISVLFLPIWYFFLNPSARFLLPVLPLWALAAGYVYQHLEGRTARAAAAAALFAHIAFGLGAMIFGNTGLIRDLPFLLGRESRTAFLEERVPEYKIQSEANALARPGDAALLGEAAVRGFYLDMPVFWSNPYLQGRYDFESMRAPREMYETFRKDGITLIILGQYKSISCKSEMELLYFNQPLWRAFVRNYTDVLQTGPNGTVLRLTPRARPETGCGGK